MMHPIMDMTQDEIRFGRASKRAQSLRKKRAEFQHKCEARSQSRASRGQRRSQSAAPANRDIAWHGAARVATRSCMVKGLVNTSADMPAVVLKDRLGSREPWQIFLNGEDASLERWGGRELPDTCVVETTMDDTTDEGSACTGHSVENSEWGTPPLSVLPEKEDVEALELPAAVIDMPSSSQQQVCTPTLGMVPPLSTATPAAQPLIREAERSDTCTEADAALNTDFTELEDEWVVVAPPGEDLLRPGSRDLLDCRHPRNRFAKKPHTAQSAHGQNALEGAWAIDWSREGIPQEVKAQIIKANMDASHRSVYAKEPQNILPFNVLRAQNISSNHRQRSTSRSRQDSVPRSQSKPRVIKQPNGKR